MKNTKVMQQAMGNIQYAKMVQAAKQYHMREDMTLRENLAQFYMEGMADDRQEFALIIADKILSGVGRFETIYSEACAEPGMGVKIALHKLEANYTTDAEKCLAYIKIADALPLISAQMVDGKDRTEKIKAIDAMEINAEDVTPEMLEEARNFAAKAVQESGVMSTGMRKLIEQMKGAGAQANLANLLLDVCNRETEYRALTAMAAYMQVRNGFVKNMSPEMEPEQVAMIVCAKREQFKILANLDARKILRNTALVLLGIIGAVVIGAMMAPGVFIIGELLFELFECQLVALGVPVIVAGVVLLEGVKLWCAKCDKAITVAVAAVGSIVKAAGDLFELYAPVVMAKVRGAVNRVRGFIAERACRTGRVRTRYPIYM